MLKGKMSCAEREGERTLVAREGNTFWVSYGYGKANATYPVAMLCALYSFELDSSLLTDQAPFGVRCGRA